jgi:tetratricopeptide (TPR) repeat protein
MVRGLFSRSKPWLLLAPALACSGSQPPAPPAPVSPAGSSKAASSSVAEASACEEKRARAQDLSNEGDQRVKIDVDAAIEKYRQAAQIDPAEHRTFWKLAMACDKKEDWPCVIDALGHATELAPNFANYWFELGDAWLALGEQGDAPAFERAKEPLERCIGLDPNFAECHHGLGVALEWTNDEQGALRAYSAAIERDPDKGAFYPPLAELYVSLGRYGEAKTVVKEGTRLLPLDEKTRAPLYALHLVGATVARIELDKMETVHELEQAEAAVADTHPELYFALGSFYATLEPPRKDRAIKLLNSFAKRVCRGSAAKNFLEECDTASSLIQRLGY